MSFYMYLSSVDGHWHKMSTVLSLSVTSSFMHGCRPVITFVSCIQSAVYNRNTPNYVSLTHALSSFIYAENKETNTTPLKARVASVYITKLPTTRGPP
jgi:hypothetical protein